MNVAELRNALEGLSGDVEIVLRGWDDEGRLCTGSPYVAELQYAHDESDTPFFAIDFEIDPDGIDEGEHDEPGAVVQREGADRDE